MKTAVTFGIYPKKAMIVSKGGDGLYEGRIQRQKGKQSNCYQRLDS